MGVKTLDQLVARASAASSEFEMAVPSSMIITRLTVFRSKGDQSLRSLLSCAVLPPLGGEAPWSFSTIFFNLRVGDFGGALMEQAGARHDDGVLGIYLDEFADEGWGSHKGSGHLDIVVSDGSGGLEEELELALGGVGVVIEDFLRAFC